MDFDLRQWLMVLGPVIIIGVLLHGYVRMRAGQNQIKMELDQSFTSQIGKDTEVDELSLLKAELPNGGARVVNAHEENAEIPVLVDPVDLPSLSATDLSDLALTDQKSSLTQEESGEVGSIVPASFRGELELDAAENVEVPIVNSRSDACDTPEMFVVINVLAVGSPFGGQALLEVLVEGDMTFGEMDIFHRIAGDEVRFSLASAVEPGTFDLAAMDAAETPGVTMFMRVHEIRDPVKALDEMLAIANAIALELNGEVRDETRSIMTPQTIEHCRQSIKEFQFKNSA